MSLISCRNISFSYDGKKVIEGLNFTIENNDYLCIIGKNGSGKSTLVKGLINIKKPSSGTIILGNGLSPNKIGYLPQQTDIQRHFPASVYEVVISGCLSSLKLKPFYTKKEKLLAKNNMKLLDILHIKNKSYKDLSGGQQQRVLLARSLCATKKLIILDEPSASLDPFITTELYKLIYKINKEMEITIIMVSHDIQSAIKYASHILHLDNRQLFFGETKDYLKSEIGQKFTEGKYNG